MTAYEYKVVPAPARGEKARGVKGPEARFAHALERVMNEMAAEGWEYQRAETLPSEERSGLTGSVTQWRNLLVFRRPSMSDADAYQPKLLDPPARAGTAQPGQTADTAPTHPVPPSAGLGVAGLQLAPQQPAKTEPTPPDAPEIATDTPKADLPDWSSASFDRAPLRPDNGVEETEEMPGLTSALRARAARITPPEAKD